MSTESTHHEAHGSLFGAASAVSMTFGRGAMARAVADLADLRATDVVVDVGCGPGTAARRARRAGAQVVGIDPSPQMLRIARWITSARRMDGVRFAEGSAERLPLATASATILWAIQSVHHWEDPNRGLEEALRVLSHGGRLILMERSVMSGARGHASHGLTEGQADELASLVESTGFAGVVKRSVRAGRRDLSVRARRHPPPRPRQRSVREP